jgi:hypothetical protein
MFRLPLIDVQRDECGMNSTNCGLSPMRIIKAESTRAFCGRERNAGFLPQLRTISRAARRAFDRMACAGYQAPRITFEHLS